MDATKTPLSYGVRQAIRDSGLPPYRFDKLNKVSARNLYRFLNGKRNLSQEAIDEIGRFLRLKVVERVEGKLAWHRPIHDESGAALPEGTPLSDYLKRAVKLHRKGLKDVATALDVSLTQLYRFLDGSRGLSQARLDSLCAFLKLFVEGPTAITHSRGAIWTKQRVYIPKPGLGPVDNGGAEGGAAPPVRPPGIYVPPSDEPDAHS